MGEVRARELRELRGHLQWWLDHVEPWTGHDATYESTDDVTRYGEMLVRVMREMAWATRGLSSRRRQEDLRNDILSGINFYAEVTVRSWDREGRRGPNAADRPSAALRARTILGTVVEWLDPAIAAKIRPEELAEVILAKAALLPVKGKRASRPKGSGYLSAFAALWRRATGERVDETALRTSYARWRRHRSSKITVSAAGGEGTVGERRTRAQPKAGPA